MKTMVCTRCKMTVGGYAPPFGPCHGAKKTGFFTRLLGGPWWEVETVPGHRYTLIRGDQ